MVKVRRREQHVTVSGDLLQYGIIGAAGLALVGGLVFGGHELGWWLTNDNINRQAHAIQNGYANQNGLRKEISDKFTTIDMINTELAQQPSNADELAASQRHTEDDLCQAAAQVNDPLPQDQAQWVSDHCSLGHYVVKKG